MNRITPEQVVAAYKETGLKPGRGSYFVNDDCACALGVLHFQKHHNREVERLPFDIETSYATGFVDGFDGAELMSDLYNNEQRQRNYNIGYEDGRAAWQACVDAGLVEEV